ncbi:MAG: hypothetical protein LBP87_01320 [Planctomycetaceae bacterium]|jgi:hypothetical protein|nr:hypothetical protein [Planctomycetaceae bacterium]
MSTLTPKEWFENWKRVAPILEEIRAKELQLMDQQGKQKEAIRKVMSMCDWCIERSEPRQTSGLVEQQRRFAKARINKTNNDVQ